ncbi:MAG: ribonuclease P protein subunit [Thaumarchaeota archaeon]|nr:ribonuclease P protein subunit [Nitrososphaerota archaeon]
MFGGMLIGTEILVLASKDKTMNGIKGLVLDETKNMLVILTPEERQVMIPKSIVTLSVPSKPNNLTIDGSKLIGTPAERIKG